ncbi:MAG: cysteine desulfurase family protein [Planctomycetota bacterium]
MRLPIYLDNNSTTRVDARVIDAMLPYYHEHYGNAASKTHGFGWRAESAVDEARGRIAALIGAQPRDIIFTSGATEANNLALLGAARSSSAKQRHVVSVATEHKSVLDPLRELEKSGYSVTYLRTDRDGRVNAQQVTDALLPETLLVSVMLANNEIGTVQPIGEIGAVTRARGVLLHCDAAQATGKVAIDVEAMRIDLCALSAHKIYGPKGVGVLYARQLAPRVRLAPIIFGGGHERGYRSGTLNVPHIVGFGVACALAVEAERTGELKRIEALTRRLRDGARDEIPDTVLNGPEGERLPGNLNLSFPGVESSALLLAMPELAVSSGSACTSASPEPSHVLRGIGLSAGLMHSSLRFGIGRFNTLDEIEYTLEKLRRTVLRLRR